jgi:hypothetical protein
MFDRLGIPLAAESELRASLIKVARETYLANGVTSIQEITDSLTTLRLQAELVRDRTIPLRVASYAWVPVAASLEQVTTSATLDAALVEPGWMELGGAKLFADGGTTSFAAAIYGHYPGQEANNGSLTYELDELVEILVKCESAGVQVMVHASGDRAEDQVLSAFDRAVKSQPGGCGRLSHRVEHAANILWTDERARGFAALKLTPAPNMGFIYHYGDFWREIYGPSTVNPIVPIRSLLDSGFHVPGTSDTAGSDLELHRPMHNIWAAVARRTLRGTVDSPEECISVEEAVRMYTEYSAVQGRYGAERGRLEPGYVGDIVVLSTDLATCASEDLDAVDVGWTIVDGSVVFERGSA